MLRVWSGLLFFLIVSYPLATLAETPDPLTPTEETDETQNVEGLAPPATRVDCLEPEPYLPPGLAALNMQATTEAQESEQTAEDPLDSVITLENPSAETKQSGAPETETLEAENSGSTEASETTEEIDAETLERWQTLATADFYYRCGEKTIAEQYYRQVKPPFKAEQNPEVQYIPEPIYDVEQLSGAGHVYWRLYQEGLESEAYASKRVSALKLMTERHPEYIPAHLAYAELMAEQGDPAAQADILQRAIAQYPDQPDLVSAQVALAEQEERWLDASIAARQFSVFNADHFRAAEFQQLADVNLERYTSVLQNEMAWSTVGNAILGGVGYALTGNLFGPISAAETTMLLLQGEANMGDRFSAQLRTQIPLIEDEVVLNYVQRIGDKLVAVSGREEFNYEFYVVMDENFNAFALPGGKIFINAGAILKTETEAELAGLIAHELAHAILSHGFQQMTKGSLTMNASQFIPFVGRSAGDLLVLNYSREMETQADLFGTQLLTATDYSADGVRNLMETMAAEEKGYVPAWLSTHPETDNRVEYIEEMIVRNQLNRYAYEGIVEHQQIQVRVKKLLNQFLAEQE